MFSSYLNIILDLIVLSGLGITIFYCIRLSKALNNFRKYRQEFNALMETLGKDIDQAQNATSKLKDTSFEAGEDLQKVLNNARKLADELQLMNDMGNALANRLERLSDTGRNKTNRKPEVGERMEEGPLKKAQNGASRGDARDTPSFFIKDKEFDADTSYEAGGSNAEVFNEDEFESRAERELFEALQKSAKGKAL